MAKLHQKKIALINDITGFGRCSVTVALPVISHLKVQCCPLPTSILSNHSGYSSYFFDDYTDKMPSYINEWKKLTPGFDCIATGFLGSEAQISIVKDFIRDFKQPFTRVLVDPVMGDNGRVYATYTPKLCADMKQLASCANILTPNLTEACILTDTPYHTAHWTQSELFSLGEKLLALGPSRAVISGISMGDFIGNVVCEAGQPPCIVKRRRVGSPRCGTGDIFSAILAADCVNGVAFRDSVGRAADFISLCLKTTADYDVSENDGVCFEEVLCRLK